MIRRAPRSGRIACIKKAGSAGSTGAARFFEWRELLIYCALLTECDRIDDVRSVEAIGVARDGVVGELRKAIVGMDEVIDEMMIAIFAQGHCLLVGVPGLAKTLLVSSLAQTLSLSFLHI